MKSFQVFLAFITLALSFRVGASPVPIPQGALQVEAQGQGVADDSFGTGGPQPAGTSLGSEQASESGEDVEGSSKAGGLQPHRRRNELSEVDERAKDGGVFRPQDWFADASPLEKRVDSILADLTNDVSQKRDIELEDWKKKHHHHYGKRDDLGRAYMQKRDVEMEDWKKKHHRHYGKRDNHSGDHMRKRDSQMEDWKKKHRHHYGKRGDLGGDYQRKRDTGTESWKWKHHHHHHHGNYKRDGPDSDYLRKRDTEMGNWKWKHRHHYGKRDGPDSTDDSEELLRRDVNTDLPQPPMDFGTLERKELFEDPEEQNDGDDDVLSSREDEHWKNWRHWHHHHYRQYLRDEASDSAANEDDKKPKRNNVTKNLEDAAHVVDSGVKGTLGGFLGFGL